MNLQPRYRPGDCIGEHYRVHEIKMGGMGEVYLCLDLKEMYPYALKTFQQRYLTNSKIHDLFKTEVATWVSLEKHPNIVRCFMMDILDNQPFMILEWIAGEEGKGADLRGWLQHGPLDLQTALEIIIDVVCGLIYAQQKQPGLVHRDLKPENILVTQGGLAKITDFGLAQIVEQAGLAAEGAVYGRHSMISKGGIAGTPAYMAPEQWRGEPLDERTDIYALGCILYEMLTGQFPFWARHKSDGLPTLPTSLPKILDDLLQSCLAKVQTERPTGLTELLSCLTNLYRQQFDQPPPSRPTLGKFTAIDYNDRGITYSNLKLYKLALADFNQAIQLNPSYVGGYANRGIAFKSLGMIEAALRDFEKAITIAPEDPRIYVNRGNAYLQQQEYELAFSDFELAIQLDPNYVKAYYNRGSALVDLAQYDSALKDFNHAIDIDPNVGELYANRGYVYQQMQQSDLALEDFQKAVKINPYLIEVYSNRGSIYSNQARYDLALEDFNSAVELDPNDAQVFSNRGLLYHKLRKYDAALQDYNRAVELAPNNAGVYFNRGVTFNQIHQFEAALGDFEKTIEIAPNYTPAYLNAGSILANLGKFSEALSFFEEAALRGDLQATKYAIQIRQILGKSTETVANPIDAALQSFHNAQSIEEMQQAVERFPFMAQPNFIAVVVQSVMAERINREQISQFERHLKWLEQIADW